MALSCCSPGIAGRRRAAILTLEYDMAEARADKQRAPGTTTGRRSGRREGGGQDARDDERGRTRDAKLQPWVQSPRDRVEAPTEAQAAELGLSLVSAGAQGDGILSGLAARRACHCSLVVHRHLLLPSLLQRSPPPTRLLSAPFLQNETRQACRSHHSVQRPLRSYANPC